MSELSIVLNALKKKYEEPDLDADDEAALDDVWSKMVGNVFCPTGEGGGVDPSCSPGGSGPSGGSKGGSESLSPGATPAERNKAAFPNGDPTLHPKSSKGLRERMVSKDTTHEGMPVKGAKDLTSAQNNEVIRWHDGMTMVNKNGPNPRLPKEASSANYDEYERGALQKYSYKNDGPLNKRLRDNDDWRTLRDGNGKEIGKVPYNDDFYTQMDKNLQSAFDKTPPMSKPMTVVRGMGVKDPEGPEGFITKMMHGLKSGESTELGGYTSTAAPGGLMYKLGADSGIPKPFRGNVSLSIKAIHGIDMGPHSQLPGEAELLLDKRSKFKVKSVTKKADGYHVELEQLHPSEWNK